LVQPIHFFDYLTLSRKPLNIFFQFEKDFYFLCSGMSLYSFVIDNIVLRRKGEESELQNNLLEK
jgi:hypothetical protein